MNLFFRIFQHLLPTGEAWKTTIEKRLRSFFMGLTGVFVAVRLYVDLVWYDLFPDTTRELSTWEEQFGLPSVGSEANRRLAVDASWKARGGQSRGYIQGIMQAAGFPVFVHDFWSAHDPFTTTPATVRNPHDYTERPLVGTFQCQPTAEPGHTQCRPRTDPNQPYCNRFLANEPGYIVNDRLTYDAPPPIPEDPDYWPYFMYVGGATFGTSVDIPASQRTEFERRILQLRPLHLWVVLFVNYTGESEDEGVFTDEFSEEFA